MKSLKANGEKSSYFNVTALNLFFIFLFLLFGPFAKPSDCLADNGAGLSLHECIETALEKNWSFIQSKLRYKESTYKASAAQKELFPKIGTDYSLLWRRDESEITIFGRKSVISPHETYNWKVYVTQPIFYGGRLWNSYKAAKLDVDISNLMMIQQANELVRHVKNLYFDLLAALKLQDEAEAAHNRLKAHLADAEAFYKAGLRTKNDFLQSKVELAKGKENLIKARHNVDLAKARLNLVMQRPLSDEIIPSDKLKYSESNYDLDQLYSLALEQRPEIQAGLLAIKKAERKKNVAKAKFWPQLNLTGAYERIGDTPLMRENPFGDTEQVTLLVKASWELWNWGQTNDQTRAAGTELALAKTALNDVKEKILFEVREAFLRLKEAEEALKVAESALEHAEENYKLYNERYRQQLATSTDVIDAQTLLTQAKSRYFISVAQYAKAKANLQYATGDEIKELKFQEKRKKVDQVVVK